MWINLKNNRKNDWQFCDENFVSRNHIEHVRGIRRQILSYLESSGLVGKNMRNYNDNCDNWSLLKAVICAGLYPFVAKIEGKKGNMYTEIDRKLSFHMSSVLCVKKEGYKSTIRKLPVEWTFFEEKNRIGRMSLLKCNTLLNSFTVSLIAGRKLIEEDYKTLHAMRSNTKDNGWSEDEWEDMTDDYEDDFEPDYMDFKVDNLLKFTASKESGKMIFDLKKCLNNLVTRFLLDYKNYKASSEENSLIKMFARIIEKEDINSGMVKMNISEDSVEETYVNSRVQNPKSNTSQSRHNQRYQNDSQQKFTNSFNNPRPSSSSYNTRPEFKNNSYQPRQRYPQDSQQKLMNSLNNQRPSSSYNVHPPTFESRAYSAPKRKIENPASGQFFNVNQKFFMLKTNSKKYIENMASKVVSTIDELNLKIWQFHKIKSFVKRGNHVYIIFYSTHRCEFQGYGEVILVNDNIPLQFHYRHPKTVKIEDLGNAKFALEIGQAVRDPTFFFHELDHVTGNSLILYF